MAHPSDVWKGILIPVLVLLAFSIATRSVGIAVVAVALGVVLALAKRRARDAVDRPIDLRAEDDERVVSARVAPPSAGPYLDAVLFAGPEAAPVLAAGTALPAARTVALLLTREGSDGATLDVETASGDDGAARAHLCRVRALLATPLALGEVAQVEFAIHVDADGELRVTAREEGRELPVVSESVDGVRLPVARAAS